jgi:hypothetical protein
MRFTVRSASLGVLVTAVAAIGTVATAQAFAGEAPKPKPSASSSACSFPSNGVTPVPPGPTAVPSPTVKTSTLRPTHSPAKGQGKPGVTKVPGKTKPTSSAPVVPGCAPSASASGPAAPTASASGPAAPGNPTVAPTPSRSSR